MNLKWVLIGQWKYRINLFLFRAKLKRKGVKRFPYDYTHAELAKLVLHHRDLHVELATKYHETLDKLKETRIELSRLKRNK
jgi:hypothetical protein